MPPNPAFAAGGRVTKGRNSSVWRRAGPAAETQAVRPLALESNVPRLIIPYSPLPPEATALLATRLEERLAKLKGLGVELNPASRLPQAVKLLKSVSVAKAYPGAEEQLRRVANAIKAAFNFEHIIDALRAPIPPGVHESLRRAVGGTLDDVEPTDAHRAQSELLFGVVIVAGGVKTGAPSPGATKTPDFVVEVDTVSFSVEVKRPGSAHAVEDKVGEAVSQIRDYRHYPGLLALDLSHVLPDMYGIKDLAEAGLRNRLAFKAAYEQARAYLVRHRSEEGYSRVALLACIAESFLWTHPDPHPIPHSGFRFYVEVFRKASEGLIVDQSRKLRDRTMEGFKELGGHLQGIARVP